MRYYVTVEGHTRVVELTPEGVVLEAGAVAAEVATVPGTRLRHLRMGDRGYLVSAVRRDRGWLFRVGGRRVRVEVEDERRRAIRELAGAEEPGGGGNELRAPMPGRIVRILVEVGQEVEPGEGLVVMEAMKMENELSARAPGRVEKIRVEPDQTVNQGDVLVVLERGGEA